MLLFVVVITLEKFIYMTTLLIVRSLRTSLEFMTSAEFRSFLRKHESRTGLKRLTERENPRALELSSIPSWLPRSKLAKSWVRAHWLERLPGRRPLHSLLPQRAAHACYQKDVPSSSARLYPPRGQGGPSTAPTGGHGLQSPHTSVVWYPPAAIKVTDGLGRGWNKQGRGGEDKWGPSASQGTALLTSPHLHFLSGAQAGVAVSKLPPLSPTH